MSRVALITGASAGIGRALALAWAERGFRLVLFARRGEELEEVAQAVRARGGEALCVVGDVTATADLSRAVAETQRTFGRLDVLVNNAGRGYYTTIRDVLPETLLALFRLNVVAPIELTQAALPLLLASEGIVVMVSSISGVASTPRTGAYAATKFALEAISQALRAELHDSGVAVLVVRPGPVKTKFRRSAELGPNDPGLPDEGRRQSPEDVAARIVQAVHARRPELETSSIVRASSLLARVAPAVFRHVSARLARRYGL